MTFKWFIKKNKKVKISNKNIVKTETVLEDDGLGENEELLNNFSKLPIENQISFEGEINPYDEIKKNSMFVSYKSNRFKKEGFFHKLKKSLFKTRKVLSTDLNSLFKGKQYVDNDLLENLEELLITSDIGVETTIDLIDKISKRKDLISSEDIKSFLREEIVKYLDVKIQSQFIDFSQCPKIVMVVGVNGVGKTSTIGKLAALESSRGNKVLVVAADTFRAAAVEQISICAKLAGADIIKHNHPNADPAALAYDGVASAISRGFNNVFIDTAGRFHTKINLMEELKKISRSISKRLPGSPHEVLLVLDATTGQNSISQAEKFNESLGITGIVLTKLDTSFKGGVIVNICRKLNIPIKYIGIGENIHDLQEFDSEKFINAMI